MFRHKPCNAIMILSFQNFHCGDYPQTHTCPVCGAYVFINEIGLQQFCSSAGNPISDYKYEFEILNQ